VSLSDDEPVDLFTDATSERVEIVMDR